MTRMLGKTKTRHCHDGPHVGGLPYPDDKARRANRAIEKEDERREVDEQLADEEDQM
jgi:hypothetical protein